MGTKYAIGMKTVSNSNSSKEKEKPKICVVIPAFRVKAQILEVIRSIGVEVNKIIVVDDACPEMSGDHVATHFKNQRVEVLFNEHNLGVGGSVKVGYKRACEIGSDVVVKIDGDGQMDCSRISELIRPIILKQADYTKGNRFSDLDSIRQMPKLRIFGNLVLSFMAKLSTGYWNIFDTNNGFTAISGSFLKEIKLDKIDNGYFFESDMLFYLSLANAHVVDISLPAIYGDEKSSINLVRVLFEFPIKHARNLFKRILYTYYLRDFNLASIELLLGILLIGFGLISGLNNWLHGMVTNTVTNTGALILIAMSTLGGLQLLLAFVSYDTKNQSK